MADENTSPTNPNTPPANPASSAPPPSAPPPNPPATPARPAASSDTVSRTEMLAEVERARGQEKQKQFDRIQQLEKQVENLTNDKQMLQAQVDTLTKSVGEDNKIDVKKIIEDVTNASANLHSQSTKELKAKIESLEKENRRERLERIRHQLIADAGGPDNLVVSLVRGDTEEELSSSLEEAKNEFLKIKARFNPPPNTETPPGQTPATTQNPTTVIPPPPVNPATTAAAGRGAGADVLEKGNVKEMTPKEYAANREDIQKSIRSRYQTPAVRR